MGDDEKEPFQLHHSDEDLLEYIDENEVVTTREVAEDFDYHLQTARRRLKSLEERGEIQMKDVGKRLVWWPSKEE